MEAGSRYCSWRIYASLYCSIESLYNNREFDVCANDYLAVTSQSFTEQSAKTFQNRSCIKNVFISRLVKEPRELFNNKI